MYSIENGIICAWTLGTACVLEIDALSRTDGGRKAFRLMLLDAHHAMQTIPTWWKLRSYRRVVEPSVDRSLDRCCGDLGIDSSRDFMCMFLNYDRT